MFSDNRIYYVYTEVIEMLATISKWGNGHGIRFSKNFMKEANLSPADKLEAIVTADKSIVMHRIAKTKAELFMERFGDYTGDWKCGETETGAAVGNEVIR